VSYASNHNVAIWWTLVPPVQASGQRFVVAGNVARPDTPRWHVENPHFYGVLAIKRQKNAFFQRFSRLFPCVLKKPWL
jgi:hypothetical protein